MFAGPAISSLKPFGTQKEYGINMTNDRAGRGKLVHVREVIKTARPLQGVLRNMTRKLGPSVLAVLDEGIQPTEEKKESKTPQRPTLEDEWRAVWACMSQRRKLMVLFKIQGGFSYSEIGEMFGIKERYAERVIKQTLKVIKKPLISCQPVSEDFFNSNKTMFKELGYASVQEVNRNKIQDAHEFQEVLSMPMEVLNLPAHVVVCLRASDCKTIADIVKRTEAEWLETRNLGRCSMDKVRKALTAKRLQFGMQVD